MGKAKNCVSKHCLMIHRTESLNNSIKMLSSSIYAVIHIICPSFCASAAQLTSTIFTAVTVTIAAAAASEVAMASTCYQTH